MSPALSLYHSHQDESTSGREKEEEEEEEGREREEKSHKVALVNQTRLTRPSLSST